MSLNLRYVVLTILLIGFLFLFVTAPTFTGLFTATGSSNTNSCENTTDYDHCVDCCQNNVNEIFGKSFYGTQAWSEKYNECWNDHCAKFSQPQIIIKKS